MSLVPLDPDRHKGIVYQAPCAELVPTQTHVPVTLDEIELAMADFPLVILKNAQTGSFELVALFGFWDRNLFWIRDAWRATYLPRVLAAGAYRLSIDDPLGLAVDARYARYEGGEQMLLSDGSPTELVAGLRRHLASVSDGLTAMQRFAQELADFRLLTPSPISLRLSDGTTHIVEGIYTINDRAVRNLADEQVLTLFRSGSLARLANVSASLAQLDRLRQLYNAQNVNKILDVTYRNAE